MIKRHHIILIVVLVVQLTLGALVLWPRAPEATVSAPLFPDLQMANIATVTVTDAEEGQIALRQEAGEWHIVSADDYPADATRVEEVLGKILGLTTARLVTRTAASHERLQVAADNFAARVELETQAGADYTLYLGSSPTYGSTHVRLEGSDETYMTSDVSAWEVNTSAATWADTTFLSIPLEEISALTLENSNGTFVFSKNSAGEWTMEGLNADETLNQAEVTALARRLAPLYMTKPLGREEQPEYGLATPSAVATVEWGESTATLRVGALNEENFSYVVSSSTSPYYVEVSQYSVEDLVGMTFERLTASSGQ